MTTFRLILDNDAGGARNMAVDEALLRTAADSHISTLRFYGWDTPTLSLGYFQRSADRAKHLSSRCCELIRRASGGGAIVHDHELTYCFATPARSRFGDAQEFYLAFHETLLEVLSKQGASAKLHDSHDGLTEEAFLCFQRRASGDLVLDKHKVLGSAQRRWRTAVVQHGSLLLHRSRYAPELPGLRDLTDFDIGVESLIQEWLERLSFRLKAEFQPSRLTDKEESHAAGLMRDKFQSATWTERR